MVAILPRGKWVKCESRSYYSITPTEMVDRNGLTAAPALGFTEPFLGSLIFPVFRIIKHWSLNINFYIGRAPT